MIIIVLVIFLVASGTFTVTEPNEDEIETETHYLGGSIQKRNEGQFCVPWAPTYGCNKGFQCALPEIR